MSKPITLYGHAGGPNPWKVAIVLEELNVPYETKYMDFGDLKKEPFESINPNGRVPAIEDPNTGVTIFESGAIIEYLIEIYDKTHKFSYTDLTSRYATLSWLYFQVSGQGPYFGQAAWFQFFHPEKGITSAIERYQNEIKRVCGVIDRHLKKTGQKWLVGDKCTFADLSFIMWQNNVGALTGGWDVKSECPEFWEWNERLVGREAVKKVLKEKEGKSAH